MSDAVPPHLCETMGRCLDDAEMPVVYNDRLREYSLQADGVQQGLTFCPFDGVELPVSVRREWYRRLHAMGLEPWEDELPVAYRTGAWWRDDPAFVDPRDDGYAITPVDLRRFVLAMGLTGPVPLSNVLAQAQELTDDVMQVPGVTHDALRSMVHDGEIVTVHDARDPTGRWSGSTATVLARLDALFADTGTAITVKLPGFWTFEVVNAIAVETARSTHAEADAWVADHRELWTMILADQ